MEGDGDARPAQQLGDRVLAAAVAEFLSIERLEVDGGEIGPAPDPGRLEPLHDAVPEGLLCFRRRLVKSYPDDIDEPAHPGHLRRDIGELDPGDTRQVLVVHGGHAGPLGDDLLDPLHLGHAEGRGELVHPVVVAQAFVVEPEPGLPAALVAHAPAEGGDALIIRDDHPAFAGGDLLVRVKGEDRRTGPRAVAALYPLVLRPQGFTGVLDDDKPVPPGDGADLVQPCRLAEGVDGEDGLGPGRDGRLDEIRIDVARLRFHVDEDGPGPFVEDAVAGGDETEGRGDDLIIFADPEGADQ